MVWPVSLAEIVRGAGHEQPRPIEKAGRCGMRPAHSLKYRKGGKLEASVGVGRRLL